MQVAGSGVVGPHSSALVALNVDAVCEKLKQIDGMDQSMIAQYIATIRKVCKSITIGECIRLQNSFTF